MGCVVLAPDGDSWAILDAQSILFGRLVDIPEQDRTSHRDKKREVTPADLDGLCSELRALFMAWNVKRAISEAPGRNAALYQAPCILIDLYPGTFQNCRGESMSPGCP